MSSGEASSSGGENDLWEQPCDRPYQRRCRPSFHTAQRHSPVDDARLGRSSSTSTCSSVGCRVQASSTPTIRSREGGLTATARSARRCARRSATTPQSVRHFRLRCSITTPPRSRGLSQSPVSIGARRRSDVALFEPADIYARPSRLLHPQIVVEAEQSIELYARPNSTTRSTVSRSFRSSSSDSTTSEAVIRGLTLP